MHCYGVIKPFLILEWKSPHLGLLNYQFLNFASQQNLVFKENLSRFLLYKINNSWVDGVRERRTALEALLQSPRVVGKIV